MFVQLITLHVDDIDMRIRFRLNHNYQAVLLQDEDARQKTRAGEAPAERRAAECDRLWKLAAAAATVAVEVSALALQLMNDGTDAMSCAMTRFLCSSGVPTRSRSVVIHADCFCNRSTSSRACAAYCGGSLL